MENKYNVDGSINLLMKNGRTCEFELWRGIEFKAFFSAEEDINFARDILTEWLNERGIKSREIADIKINISYS